MECYFAPNFVHNQLIFYLNTFQHQIQDKLRFFRSINLPLYLHFKSGFVLHLNNTLFEKLSKLFKVKKWKEHKFILYQGDP